MRVNQTRREDREGRPVWVKRRKRAMGPVLLGGNLFLRFSGSRLRMFPALGEWRRWELGCFERLHGPQFRSGVQDSRTIWFDALPGESLRDLLARGALTPACLEAAARELRRAHALSRPGGGETLSHGDAHLGNFLFDPVSRLARLSDFEQAHEPGADALWRRADDLLVFLLDLLGRAADEDWPRLGAAFLAAYQDPQAVAALRDRLIPPEGLAAVLWRVRAYHRSDLFIARRLEALARGT